MTCPHCNGKGWRFSTWGPMPYHRGKLVCRLCHPALQLGQSPAEAPYTVKGNSAGNSGIASKKVEAVQG